MKKLFNNILTKSMIAMLLYVGVSCQDLVEEPKSMSTPENFYTTPAQCQSAYVASMNVLYNAWGNYAVSWWGSLPDGQAGSSTLDYGQDYFSGIWQCHYVAILDINPALKAIKGGRLATFDPAVVADVEAQGKFYRAFNHFNLVRTYGAIPYITDETPDPVVNPLTKESRLPVADVYNKIQEDLEFAVANLNDYDGGASQRVNLWTAKALLAKVYLTRATAPLNEVSYYAKARDMADDVIVNGPYSLLPDFRDVFKSSNKYNDEMIMSFQTTNDDPNVEGALWAPGELGGWDGGPVNLLWAEAYPEQPRKYNYVLMDWSKDIFDPSAPIIHYTASGAGVPFIGKFNMPNISYDEQIGISSAQQSLLRFADVLLMYSEAANMAEGGPSQLAVDRLNLIIDRANTPSGNDKYGNPELPGTEARATTAMSQAEFDKKVIDERSYELCFEYDRLYDVFRKRILKEVNKADDGITYGFQISDYLFPIPTYDATFIGQNPIDEGSEVDYNE